MFVFGRLGTVDDIVSVIAFIAGDEARWITGQNIRVNGGPFNRKRNPHKRSGFVDKGSIRKQYGLWMSRTKSLRRQPSTRRIGRHGNSRQAHLVRLIRARRRQGMAAGCLRFHATRSSTSSNARLQVPGVHGPSRVRGAGDSCAQDSDREASAACPARGCSRNGSELTHDDPSAVKLDRKGNSLSVLAPLQSPRVLRRSVNFKRRFGRAIDSD